MDKGTLTALPPEEWGQQRREQEASPTDPMHGPLSARLLALTCIWKHRRLRGVPVGVPVGVPMGVPMGCLSSGE